MRSRISDNFKTQEMCNKAVKKDPCLLAEVPDHLKTQKKMCNKAVEDSPWHIIDISEDPEAEEMCNKAVKKDPFLLIEVADHLKSQEMYNKAVEEN